MNKFCPGETIIASSAPPWQKNPCLSMKQSYFEKKNKEQKQKHLYFTAQISNYSLVLHRD